MNTTNWDTLVPIVDQLTLLQLKIQQAHTNNQPFFLLEIEFDNLKDELIEKMVALNMLNLKTKICP